MPGCEGIASGSDGGGGDGGRGKNRERLVVPWTRNLIQTARNETRNAIEQTVPLARPASVC